MYNFFGNFFYVYWFTSSSKSDKYPGFSNRKENK